MKRPQVHLVTPAITEDWLHGRRRPPGPGFTLRPRRRPHAIQLEHWLRNLPLLLLAGLFVAWLLH